MKTFWRDDVVVGDFWESPITLISLIPLIVRILRRGKVLIIEASVPIIGIVCASVALTDRLVCIFAWDHHVTGIGIHC